MNVTIKLESSLDCLIRMHSGFAQIQGVSIESSPVRLWERPYGKSSHDLLVAVIGKSGYGKSSLTNQLIGCSVMETSAAVACTRDAQCADFRIDEGHYLSFVDLPGIGESAERDREYLAMYQQIISRADLIVYLLRADSRDLAIDEAAWESLFPDQAYRNKVLIALNCCDKVEPVSRVWNSSPSSEQLVGVDRRVELIRRACPWIREIVPCCANPGWNMDKLVEAIVERLLNSEGVTPSLESQIRRMEAAHRELAQTLSRISRLHAQLFG